MGYNLRSIEREPFKGGKNILASEHVQFVEAGATLAAGLGPLQVGQAMARIKTLPASGTVGNVGEWTKYNEANVANFDDFGILNVDAETYAGDQVVVGELIVRGSVYEAKCVGVTDTFKTKTPMIRYVKNL
jgi:hypothetical protein